MRVRVLVVPVYKRTWLFHADAETSSEAAALDWAQAHAPADKLRLLGQHMTAGVMGAARSQWQALQTSRPGTFQHSIYKLAQRVLSNEDPAETFLKSIPKDTLQVEIVYPASLSEKVVRRRLRMLCARGAMQHKRNAFVWTLATVPQLPLILTPFPNLTLYYSMYRLMSSWQACAGAEAMQRAFNKLDAVQMHQMQSDALVRRHAPAEALLRRLTAKEEEHQQRVRHKHDAAESSAMPAPTFVRSQQLDDIVRPLERWKTPLSDEVARQLGSSFSIATLSDEVARMRQRATAQFSVLA